MRSVLAHQGNDQTPGQGEAHGRKDVSAHGIHDLGVVDPEKDQTRASDQPCQKLRHTRTVNLPVTA